MKLKGLLLAALVLFGLLACVKTQKNSTNANKQTGCYKPAMHPSGGVQVEIDAGVAGDGQRSFYLSLPKHYDASVKHKLIIGYPGTNWTGKKIQPYFGLEEHAQNDEIFVYPDPLWRKFEGWGDKTIGGWVLGPHAKPADGMGDVKFTEAMINYMQQNYCVDSAKVFTTGHSWGGDMAAVIACFAGDKIRASIPIAANRPYWFQPQDNSEFNCKGDAAVWTLFGLNDTHFNWQSYPGQFGNEQHDFWTVYRQCDGKQQFIDLNIGSEGECIEQTGCSSLVRYCLYDKKFGHQKPDYFAQQAMKFFRTFK